MIPSSSTLSLPDNLIARLHAGGPRAVPDLLANVPEADRVRLAVFCYQRAHLHTIGLAIAATCDPWTLRHIAGVVGETLFELSRASPPSLDKPHTARSKVTLARSIGRHFAPLDVEVEMDEALAPA
jgi:hypothetical protein